MYPLEIPSLATNFVSLDQTQSLSPLQRHYIAQLLKSENRVGTRKSNPISVWHTISKTALDSIVWYGMANSNTLGKKKYINIRFFLSISLKHSFIDHYL